MKKFTIMIASFCLLSCSDNKQKEETSKNKLGDFVYIDKSSCLHTDKNCINLLYLSDNETGKNYQVNFVETKKLSPSAFNSLCSCCVSDETFKQLKNTIEQNGYIYEEEEIDSVAAY